jgi:hypothetical protein
VCGERAALETAADQSKTNQHSPSNPDADAASAKLQKDLDKAQGQFKEFEIKDTKVRVCGDDLIWAGS